MRHHSFLLALSASLAMAEDSAPQCSERMEGSSFSQKLRAVWAEMGKEPLPEEAATPSPTPRPPHARDTRYLIGCDIPFFYVDSAKNKGAVPPKLAAILQVTAGPLKHIERSHFRSIRNFDPFHEPVHIEAIRNIVRDRRSKRTTILVSPTFGLAEFLVALNSDNKSVQDIHYARFNGRDEHGNFLFRLQIGANSFNFALRALHDRGGKPRFELFTLFPFTGPDVWTADPIGNGSRDFWLIDPAGQKKLIKGREDGF